MLGTKVYCNPTKRHRDGKENRKLNKIIEMK
jgi:hypothetical protein